MDKITVVMKREFLTKVRSKYFAIGTILGPILMVGIVVVPMLFAKMQTGGRRTLGVVDKTGVFAADLKSALDDTLPGGERKYRLVDIPPYGRSADEDELRASILADIYDGVLIVGPDALESNSVKYMARNVTDFQELERIESAVSDVVVSHRLSQEGLDPSRVKQLTKHVDLKTLKATKEGAREEKGATFFLTFVLVFFLYMTVLLYGISVMRSILEEKSSRVVEVVLSSVKPFQLMMGKILGTGAVGLVQFTVWAGFGVLAVLLGGSVYSAFGAGEMPLSGVPISLFLYFVVYFLLGFFLYATLYAAVGAIATTEQEAQQVQRPVTILVVIPILLLNLFMRTPDSNLAVAFSLVPFFSPILMFARICIASPPGGEIALSIGILIASILLSVWVVAKIYRVGILMYGKRATLPEIVKWLRY